MKRIIAENVLANVRLEAATCEDSVTRFRVLSRDVVMFRGVSIDKAFRMYDLHVDKALLHTQPEKVVSGIDLENPPVEIETSNGLKATHLGKVRGLENPYIVLLTDGFKDHLVFSNRHGGELLSAINGENFKITLRKKPIKKIGWINIYRYSKSGICIHDTKDEAIEHSVNMDHVKDTIQITWEE